MIPSAPDGSQGNWEGMVPHSTPTAYTGRKLIFNSLTDL